jgi:tRNA G18 (ribose-2'-O)-methylase SpoU
VAAAKLRSRGKRLWALEGGSPTQSLFTAVADAGGPADPAIVLVLGHEVSGIDPRVLEHCERRLTIPMGGIKGSLNVGVAFGIAVYVLRHTLR